MVLWLRDPLDAVSSLMTKMEAFPAKRKRRFQVLRAKYGHSSALLGPKRVPHLATPPPLVRLRSPTHVKMIQKIILLFHGL